MNWKQGFELVDVQKQLTAASVTSFQVCKQPQGLSADEWVNEMWGDPQWDLLQLLKKKE